MVILSTSQILTICGLFFYYYDYLSWTPNCMMAKLNNSYFMNSNTSKIISLGCFRQSVKPTIIKSLLIKFIPHVFSAWFSIIQKLIRQVVDRLNTNNLVHIWIISRFSKCLQKTSYPSSSRNSHHLYGRTMKKGSLMDWKRIPCASSPFSHHSS